MPGERDLLAELQRRADELALLNEIGRTVLSTLDLDEVLRRLLGQLRRVVRAEAVSILLWDEAGQALTFTAADGPGAQHLVGLRVPAGQGIAGWVAQTRRSILVNDVRGDPRWYPKVDEAIAFHSRSLACVPILRGDELVGVLEAVNKLEGLFVQHDLDLLEALTHWAAEAISNARAFGVKRRQTQVAESLAEISAILAATIQLPDVLSRVLDQVMRLVPCADAWISIRAGDEMRIEAARMRETGRVATTRLGHTYRIHDDPPTAEIVAERRGTLRAASAEHAARLDVPLVIGERVIGQIALAALPGQQFTRDDLQAITTLAQPAAAAIENAHLYNEATHRLQEMTILQEVALATSTTLDFDDLLLRTIETLRHSVAYEIISVWLADETGTELILHPASIGLPEAVMQTRLSLDDGAPGQVARTGFPVRLDQTEGEAHSPAIVPGVVSTLAVPLKMGDQVIGVLSVESARPFAFRAEDERLLAIVARQLAIVLLNSRLFQTVRERAVHLTVLNHVARKIVGALDADEIIRLTVNELGERFVFTAAAVLTVDENGQRLRLRGAAGTQAHSIPAGYTQPLTTGVLGRVATSGETYLANEARGDPLFADALGRREIGSGLCVPILRDGIVIGVLYVERAQPGGFTESDVLTMEALAGLLANALQSAQLFGHVQASIAELRQTQAQLIQTEKVAAIGRLTASIAHEVNNPLQSIHNCLRLAEEERLSPERRREYLQMAGSEVTRLMDGVRRMLEFYRPAAAERTAASINALLEDVLALADKQIRDTHVELVCDFAPDLPPVTAVPNHLRQVFLNLILNALEAMPNGGTLRITTLDQTGTVRARFADSGLGISPEEVSKIFEPFYTTKDRGTGLGLSVSYGIVAAHGGWIDVQSEVGAGTVFTVNLPVNSNQ